uniref:Uncharacterized protein n=1 Tax=Arundo donax TaxID=35708 RepID=A0A0A9G3J4_ARUDO
MVTAAVSSPAGALQPRHRIQRPAPATRMTSWISHRVAPSCRTEVAAAADALNYPAPASASAAASSSGRSGKASSFHNGDGLACPAFRHARAAAAPPPPTPPRGGGRPTPL